MISEMSDMKYWGFGALLLALAAAAVLAPPLATPQTFRTLADTREILGIPNFADVVSNVPLLLVGLWGLYALRRTGFVDWPWTVVFLMVALTGPCSAYYHLAPDDARLMWDRLPISMAFMALLSAVLAERIGTRAGVRLLVPLVLAGAASVLYWRWSVLQGAENILPYAVVQFGAMAAIVLAVLLFPARYTRGGDFFAAFGLYGLAKLAEALDAEIYALGEIVSGHTLKHLLAACAVAWLVRMLYLRKNRDVPHFRAS